MIGTEGALSVDGKRMKAREERLTLLWKNEIHIGGRVVLKASGITGTVEKIMKWGVEVWTPVRGAEREIWSWEMIVKRNPRSIKRYPRPFRFPRTEPTKTCHCKGGPMSIVKGGDNAVRCQNKKCKQLIGPESWPKRIERASALLYQAAVTQQSKPKVAPRAPRPKPKAARTRKPKGNEAPGALGVGSAGPGTESPSAAPTLAEKLPAPAMPKRKEKQPKAQLKARPRRALQVPKTEISSLTQSVDEIIYPSEPVGCDPVDPGTDDSAVLETPPTTEEAQGTVVVEKVPTEIESEQIRHDEGCEYTGRCAVEDCPNCHYLNKARTV
jgi:hypothetical protein